MENINVLYIDSDLDNQETFRANFSHYYNVFITSSIEEVKIIPNTHKIQVIVADQKTWSTPGEHIRSEFIKTFPQRVMIVLASKAKNEPMDTVERGLIFKYLVKPYLPDVLKQVIDASHYLHRLKLKEERLHADLVVTQNELNSLKMK